MIPDKIKDLIHESKMLLKNDEEYKHLNMDIHYVLENTNDIRKSIIFAVDDGEEMAEIDLEELSHSQYYINRIAIYKNNKS